MVSTFTQRLTLEKIATGEQENTWGVTEGNTRDLIDAWVAGYEQVDVSGGANVTLTASQYQNRTIILTGTLTANIDVILPQRESQYLIENLTSGAFTITIKRSGQSGGVQIEQGTGAMVYGTGTDMFNAVWSLAAGGTGTTDAAGARTAFSAFFDKVKSQATAYTVELADRGHLFACDATTAAFTLTLPPVAQAGDGYVYGALKVDTSANGITIDPDGSETINGAAAIVLDDPGDGAIFVSDGTQWWAFLTSIPLKISALQNQTYVYAPDSGAANAIVMAPAVPSLGYTPGQRWSTKVAVTNTGAVTVDVSGLGAQALKKNVTADLEAGDITAGQMIQFEYDGTNFQLVSPIPAGLDPASKAEMEASTANDKAVTPANIKWSPSTFQAYVEFDAAGAILRSNNVSSVTLANTNVFTVNFSTAFADTSYLGAGMCTDSNFPNNGAEISYSSSAGAKLTGSCQVATTRNSSREAARASVGFMGRLA